MPRYAYELISNQIRYLKFCYVYGVLASVFEFKSLTVRATNFISLRVVRGSETAMI